MARSSSNRDHDHRRPLSAKVPNQSRAVSKRAPSFFDKCEDFTQDWAASPWENYLSAYAEDIELLSQGPNNPTNPAWGATVYVDPERYGDRIALNKLRGFYANGADGVRFVNLKPSELEHWTPFFTKVAENDFRQRGYLADIERVTYGKGEGGDSLLTVKCAQSAADHQLAKLAAFASASPSSPAKMQKSWSDLLCRSIGQETVTVSRPDPKHKGKEIEVNVKKDVPLVEESGIYRPSSKIPKRRRIHLAYNSALNSSLRSGLTDKFGFSWATQHDIRDQIRFEMRHSDRFFGDVSRKALFVWQSQVLAILRKAAWDCAFTKSHEVRQAEDDILHLRMQMLTDVASRGRSAIDRKSDAFERPTVLAFSRVEDNIKGLENDEISFGQGYKNSDFVHGLNSDEVFIAALHGSPYRPPFDPNDDFDRRDPTFTICELAAWFGKLKRNKYVNLDKETAYKILRVSGESDEDTEDPYYECWRRFEAFFSTRMREPIWTVLKCAAAEVFDRKQTIGVRYQWARNLDKIWSASREQDDFLLTGPLLDFPVDDAKMWNTKAKDLPVPPIFCE